VVKWLLKQKTYTVHQPYRSKFIRNPIVSKNIDHNWHADLVEIRTPESNDGYKYILMIIDNLSKYGWAEKLKSKKSETVKRAFQKILQGSKRKPKILSTDAGTEFTNASFKGYLRYRKIKHLVATGTTKAAVVERWNRTIKDKIQKYLTFTNSRRFIHVLPYIIAGYNATLHSRSKFKPIEVSKKNENQVYRNLFIKRVKQKIDDLKIGDAVRVQYIRKPFDKGYKANYSDEVFFIDKILFSSPNNKYKVVDENGIRISGSYYAKELIKIENGSFDRK
jgi:transposase InsO family protein